MLRRISTIGALVRSGKVHRQTATLPDLRFLTLLPSPMLAVSHEQQTAADAIPPRNTMLKTPLVLSETFAQDPTNAPIPPLLGFAVGVLVCRNRPGSIAWSMACARHFRSIHGLRKQCRTPCTEGSHARLPTTTSITCSLPALQLCYATAKLRRRLRRQTVQRALGSATVRANISAGVYSSTSDALGRTIDALSCQHFSMYARLAARV